MQTIQLRQAQVKREKESIHSGQFMVSHFEAEEQDDEDEVAVPIPEVADVTQIEQITRFSNEGNVRFIENQPQIGIDTSLAKLFQCMSLAYRQKLTSPKWNRFRGIKLTWKDKIRLNNVIWRCWHLQFIRKENTLICQFASPLDVDTHNKPEAVVLEGKYWKRKLAAVTAEYKKWRMYYRNHASGQLIKDDVEMLKEVDLFTWNTQSTENDHMMVDEDYMSLMSDTLFSTISNQPFVFPDSREIAKAGLADFIQPSLGPLQPNLDDYMDTLEPLHEFMAHKLPPVPEEQGHDNIFKQVSWPYSDLDLITTNPTLQVNSMQNNYPQVQTLQQLVDKTIIDNRQQQQQQQQIYSSNDLLSLHHQTTNQYIQPLPPPPPPPSYHHSTVISKTSNKCLKNLSASLGKLSRMSNNNSTSSSTSSTVQVLVAPSSTTSSSSSSSVAASTQIYNKLPNIINTSYTSYQATSERDPLELTLEEQEQQAMLSKQQFKLLTSSTQHDRQQTTGYKFTTPVIPNLKFTTSQQQQQQQQQVSGINNSMMLPVIHNAHSQQYHTLRNISKEEKSESTLPTTQLSSTTTTLPTTRIRGAARGRQRSRSNTREPIKRPPLISAISDPSLITPSNSVLLTQLLTSSDNNLFNRSTTTTNQQQIPITTTTTTKSKTPIKREQSIRIKEENNSTIGVLSTSLPTTSSQLKSSVAGGGGGGGGGGGSSGTINTIGTVTTPTTLIITPLNINPQLQSPTTTNDSLLLNSFSDSNSPIQDNSSLQQNLNSPTSSSQGSSSIESPSHHLHQQQHLQQLDTTPHKDHHRRVGHIHAEQKRRYNIKTGFDMMHSLIPHLTQNPNAKLSKAAMLQKGAEYIRQLRSDRHQLDGEMNELREEIDTLNQAISNCQSLLPATGAPVSRRRGSKMQEMFDEYVRKRTMENWKFWIFSLLFRPLLTTFNNIVSTTSLDDLYRSTMLWIEQHCTLVDLRPLILNALRYLSGTTDILAAPERLSEEIHELVLSNHRT